MLSEKLFLNVTSIKPFLSISSPNLYDVWKIQKHLQAFFMHEDYCSPGYHSKPSSQQLLCKEFEEFTCLIVYTGPDTVQDLNKLQYTMLMTRYSLKSQLLYSDTGINTSLLPPCKTSLRMHILRASYQTMIWN